MSKEWNEAALQQYIDSAIEESSNLEYKAADALERTEGKKKEITKDVSAMANAAGGTVIYGIKEYDDPDNKHLPEAITPINRTQFSKEWLEQVINNIRPHISDVVIYPISLSSSSNDVAYVVDIPQSNTAHQALDFRYYRRFNFQVLPMEDYEIRDVMNRGSSPDASVEFSFLKERITSDLHRYKLELSVKNNGPQMINYFQLVFTFPGFASFDPKFIRNRDNISIGNTADGDHLVTYRSRIVLFSDEKRLLGEEFNWFYEINLEKYNLMSERERKGQQTTVAWTLYADNMKPKQGEVPFSQLNCF